jgi:uncharacterized membrane protein YoaK (UPF0700 family)
VLPYSCSSPTDHGAFPRKRQSPETITHRILLIAATVLAVRFGPFKDGDSGLAMATGLTLVAAMAIQNAAHRIDLGATPPSTVLTGTTTQLMIDVADAIGGLPAAKRDSTRQRMHAMGVAVVTFGSGAALAAFLFHTVGTWCFAVAPTVALVTRMLATR